MGKQHFRINGILKLVDGLMPQILFRLEHIGFVGINFTEPHVSHGIDSKNNFLTTKEIVETLTNNKAYFGGVGGGIYTKYQDTAIDIGIFQFADENYLSVGWDTETSSWEKAFPIEPRSDDEDAIIMRDNARHARVLLEIIEPFLIKEFVIHDEDYVFFLPEIPYGTLAAHLYMNLDTLKIAWMFTDNIMYNKCIVFDSFETKQAYSRREFNDILYQQLIDEKPLEFCVQRDEYFIDVKIDNRQVFLTPLEPVKKKTYKGEEGIDLGFYVKLLLGFCDDFIIEELKTHFAPPEKPLFAE